MQRPFARPHNNQGDEYEQPHDTYADEDIPDAFEQEVTHVAGHIDKFSPFELFATEAVSIGCAKFHFV